MGRVAPRLAVAAGLLLALFAIVVAVRAWLGERSFVQGQTAQRRGFFAAADAAYRTASDRGNADAASARVRLDLLRRDWDGAAAGLRTALALAPTRALPRLLQAQLEVDRPGPWDGAREERVLAACRSAVALEPGRGAIWSETASVLLKLVSLRRALWDPARTGIVIAEAAAGFAEALALDPGAARKIFLRMLVLTEDPVFLLDVAARRREAASLAALVALLLEHTRWAEAEPCLWVAAEERGILPAYAAAASEVLARRGLIREALAAARRGLVAAPGDGALTVRAADIAARLPGAEALAAVPLYRSAVADASADLAVRRRFAGFLAARDLFGEAESEARAVVGTDPKNAEAWFLLGEIMRRSGRTGEAAAAYRQAAGLRPENAAYRKAAAASQR